MDSEWKEQLSCALKRVSGEETCEQILSGMHKYESSETGEEGSWVRELLSRMQKHLTSAQTAEALSSCACRYPTSKLLRAREAYLKNGSVDDAISELSSQLEDSLREGMLFEQEIVEWLLDQGWGVAGKREGNRILVTKIPKSGNLRQYMSENNQVRQRELYCHCSQVSRAVAANLPIPVEYCHCGAGFYRWIWEGILERPVSVEILETVCSGGDRCSFTIHLPEFIE